MTTRQQMKRATKGGEVQMLHLMHAEQAMRDREREIRKRIRDRRPAKAQHPSRSVRRAVGRSIMSIGAFVAAEPQARLARSR